MTIGFSDRVKVLCLYLYYELCERYFFEVVKILERVKNLSICLTFAYFWSFIIL